MSFELRYTREVSETAVYTLTEDAKRGLDEGEDPAEVIATYGLEESSCEVHGETLLRFDVVERKDV